ncbi:MAG: aminopeptidase [Candidatus Binatia bacterium]|nr:aminopeptidase [Candidatus Binatia bacterium]
MNRSQIHIDFMIGSPEVDVTGVTASGERVPRPRVEICRPSTPLRSREFATVFALRSDSC